MHLIRKKAYARAGLVGNPSDGYFGKTLSMIVRNFAAEVTLYEWDQLEVVASQKDRSRFDSLEELVRDVACTATTAASAWSRPRSRSLPSTAGETARP